MAEPGRGRRATAGRTAPGGGRPLGALLLAAVLVALTAFGLARFVGWGTPVPQHVILPPAIPPPPVAPAPG